IGMLAKSQSRINADDRLIGRSGSREQGFTLIELLVVVLIISITLGFALIAVGDFGEHRKIRNAAEGFSQFLEFIHERALLESSTLKVQLTASGYTTTRLATNDQWQALKGDMYHFHTLPLKTFITVANGSTKSNQLAVIMSGTGDMTPFKVSFGTVDHPHLATIIGKSNGKIIFYKDGS
ncbi:MAG TPA: prepilin-type N-terminal cleavage/methylation domain-containing protein, partial [Legionellaceae bacterium]|nr:prepilin-type N-terminal cleavage/methylation domain-containing protein [Legionellaceae bacterium]